jgi:hypothetical protein
MVDKHGFEAVTQLIVQQIAATFRTSVLIADVGVLRLLDHDDACVWLGLFPIEEDVEHPAQEPVMTWTIDASDLQQGN